ncbi:hypothetical protein ACI2K4_25820 [Micromonospora sp. NPDC050397]|uniref:hypothetical protein n=1 Tax=Micromonospora sp. NPDC050397 TaxID=3364279 RepID=UPI00384E8F28
MKKDNGSHPATHEPAGGTLSRRTLSALGLAGMVAAGGQLLAPSVAQAESRRPEDERRPARRNPQGDPVDTVARLRRTRGSAGQWVWLSAYHGDQIGRGGGDLYWDAASTERDNGGTVFAVEGVATGRWKRPTTNRLDLTWFGWTGRGTGNDSPLVQEAVNALPTGGVIEAGPGKIRLEQTVTVDRVPITFQGAGASDNVDYSTQYVVATGTADGFRLSGARGGGMRDLQVRGEGLTGGYLLATERSGTDGNYMLSFANVRFRDGHNGMALRACNTVRFVNCVWNGFVGEQVILLNGVGDGSRADPVEFVECGIAAGTGNDNTDNLVIDGLGGSIKFISTALLFGRHGLWLRNTTGQATPKFLYFEGGGFENGHGVPVLLDAGAQVHFANTYISADNEHDDVRIGTGFAGSATFVGCVLRGCGRNGLDIASTRVTVTGCLIGNNGRTAHPAFSRAVERVAANPSGDVRVTTAVPHGWETEDRITVSDVTGSTEANGKRRITVVGPTEFDLVGVRFERAYTGGGSAYRNGAGINIRSTASRVVITGNVIGALADGISRQDYGIVNDAADVLVTSNDLAGNTTGAYLITGAQSTQTRFVGNKGVEQIDGWLSAQLVGPLADGLYDLRDFFYLDGQRIRITKVTRKLASGGCNVRLDLDGTSAGGPTFAVSTQLQSTNANPPFALDSVGAPRRLQLRVSGAAAAQGLEVQFAYQLIS